MHTVRLLVFAATFWLFALLAPLASARDARAEYQTKLDALELEIAQRHVDVGLWCRERGFAQAAREHFLNAVEVSRGRHAHASSIKSLMERLGDEFWKKQVELTDARRKPYDKQVEKLERENVAARFKLASWAHERGLESEALAAFRALLDPEAPLVVNAKGQLQASAGQIPAACSAKILAEAISINGEPHVRHGVLALLAGVDSLSQASAPALLVRSTGTREQVEEFLKLGLALLPELERELSVRLERRPTLLLIDSRATYERYLVEADRQSYRSASGFADIARCVTLVCTEGKSLLEVQSLALHELSHLADAAAFPQAMPAWYSEGFAERFGGVGTFSWDGARLTLRGELDSERLTLLRGGGTPWPIAELVRIDPVSLWGSDREQAKRYYAQSWALYRWLSSEAPSSLRVRWDAWIASCKSAKRGFPPGPQPVPTPEELFRKHFDGALAELDSGLVNWLEVR
jgi:hypothetical protein